MADIVERLTEVSDIASNYDLVRAALAEITTLRTQLAEARTADVARAYAEAFADGWRYRALHPKEGNAADPVRESEAWIESRARATLERIKEELK